MAIPMRGPRAYAPAGEIIMDEYVGSADTDAVPDGPFVMGPLEPFVLDVGMTEGDLVDLCRQVKEEARSARASGRRPRDDVWSENLELYNGEIDWGDKESWQHQEVFRDATKHVDRFAGTCKRAVMQPGEWYTIKKSGSAALDDLHAVFRKLLDSQLNTCATTTSGWDTSFRHVFSKIVKMGGVMAMAASVTKHPHENRICVDEVDPRELYYDPTGRGMYRLRTREIDKHTLEALSDQVDDDGVPLWWADRIDSLTDMRRERGESEGEQAKGHNEGGRPQGRQTRVLDEFLFRELVNRDGVCVGKNVLVVMANEQRIVRGPEPNPCWHGRDWIVFQSLLDTFLTVYGRAYMEDFAAVCRTYIRFTALLVDAATTTALPNYAMRPDLLVNQNQIHDGVRPFKTWWLNDEATKASDFAERMDLGRVYPESFELWKGLKAELREGAMQNQMELGQVPTKSDITATEVNTVHQAGSELVVDVAESIDDGLISPILELVFWTAVQELDFTDPALVAELGPEVAGMFAAQRADFEGRRVRFKAAAITALAERAVRVQKILQGLQIVGQSEILTAQFVQDFDLAKVLGVLWRDIGLDDPELRRKPGTEPAVPPNITSKVAADEANAERHRAAIEQGERVARSNEQRAAIAAEQAAQQAELAARESQSEGGEA
jgi:hypothetical protein